MMDVVSVKPPLTNVQFELLKAFAVDIPEDELIEFRRHISQYFLQRARDAADKVWKEKGYDDSTIEKWLNEDQ